MTLTNRCVDVLSIIFSERYEGVEVCETFYACSDSLLLTPLCCDDIHDVTPRVSALAGCDTNYSCGSSDGDYGTKEDGCRTNGIDVRKYAVASNKFLFCVYSFDFWAERSSGTGSVNVQKLARFGAKYGRLTELEFPKFHGEDVQGWLYRVHQFFKIDHIEDASYKIRLDEYEREIKIRFDSVYEDPMVELKNLRQTTTVQVKNNTHAQSSTTVPNRPFKRLTQQELEEKKAKHLYFYYDQKYIPGHKCSGQVFSLEVIGVDVEEDDDLLLTKEGVTNSFHSLVDEQPLIYLNGLSGVNTYRTMRVKGSVGKNVIHVLVD
ncbi:hypothetical protein Tco_1243887 [Tanacetum coccineum]